MRTDGGSITVLPATAHEYRKESGTDENDDLQDGEKAQLQATAEGGIAALSFVALDSEGTLKKPRKPFSFYMAFISLQLLAVITSWDSTSLAIALPTITEILQGTTFESFWASISFTLGVVVIQPVYVSVSDVVGRKYPLYAAMILFAVGAIVFATASNMGALIAGRLIQGLGAGGIDVLEEIVLADITTLKERPKYLGLLAIAIAGGSISGPIIGAVFAEFVDWRWIGWVNLPIVGAAFVLSFFFLHLRSIELSFGARLRRLDWIGMALFTVGMTAFATPLSWAESLYSWASWRTLVPFIIGLLILIFFAVYEKKPQEAVMPHRLFGNVTAVSSLLAASLQGLIMYTMLLYLPLFFQAVFLESPIRAAVSTLPVCSLVVAFSVVAPVVIELTRRYRVLLWVGWLLTTLFLGLWCLVDRATSKAEAYAFQALLGVGTGIIFTGTQVPVQASVGHVDDTGLSIGVMVVLRWVGALFGQTIGSTAFTSVFRSRIATIGPLPPQVSVLSDASTAIAFISELRRLSEDLSPQTMNDVVGAYQQAFRAIWIVVTCFSGVGLIISLFMKEVDLEREEVGRQGFEQRQSS